MKKKLLNSMRVLLVAAGLCTGAGNVWADTYTILYGTAVMDGETTTGVSAQTDFTGDVNEATEVSWTDGNGNSGYPIDGSTLIANTTSGWTKYFETPVTAGTVYYAANYTATANGTSHVFQIVDSKGYAIYKSMVTCGTSNGSAKNETKAVATICGEEINSYIRLSKNATYSVKSLSIDLDLRKVKYELWTSSNNSGGSTLSGTISLPEEVTDVQGLSVLKASQTCYLDNVLLYSQLPDGTKYTHTINAYDKSNNALGTVAFNAKYAESEDGAAETLYYSKFIKSGETWYGTNNASGTYYGYSFAGATETKDINTYEARQDIVYFQEAEDMSSSGNFNGCSQYNRYSRGGARRHQGKAYLYTNALPAGVYDVTVGGREENSKDNQSLTISVLSADKKTWTTAGTVGTWGKAAVTECTLKGVVVGEGEYIVIDNHSSSYSTNVASDYIYLTKSKISVTVGANGYTTFASSYALDLTDENRPDGLKAYKATLAGTTLTFTALNQTVPAGTGLLLLGETNGETYEIPAVFNGDAVTNDLVGVTTDTPLQSTEGGIYYFVMKKATTAEDALAFAPLSTSTAVTIPAGKAYVELDTYAGARSLTVAFDDETTGINSVNGEGIKGNGFYNLNGQRVESPTKGLYIMNGKKVILK